MSNVLIVNLDEKRFAYRKKYETVISGICPAILPLNIVKSGDCIRGIYRTEGFVRLSSLSDISAARILTAAERIIECTEICRDYLLFPEEYVLTADTVYISEDFRTVKLAYIPVKPHCSEKKAIAGLIRSLKRITTENGRMYLETLGTMLECSNLKVSKVTGFIEHLKQEINLCGIE